MSAEAVGWVYKHSPYDGVNFAVHLATADSANDLHEYEIWARQQWIADKARVSRSGVNRFIKQAIDDGLLLLMEDNSRAGHANRYRLLMPDDTPKAWSPSTDTTPRVGVAPRYTPPNSTPCLGVAPHDRGCSTTLQGVSHHATHNPREPNSNPTNTSAPPPATPSEPRVFDDDGLEQVLESGSAETGSSVDRDDCVDRFDKSGRAREMCDMLARAIESEHGFTPKVTDTQWVRPMDLLLRRGATEWADPKPIDRERVEMMIGYVYTYGTEGDRFRWADQIKSPMALRRHWEKLRVWANREHQARAKGATQGSISEAWMVRSGTSG